MQKIFIITSELDDDPGHDGNSGNVNIFMGEDGKIISVTPQSMGGDNENRGRWLVVADDGKGENIKL